MLSFKDRVVATPNRYRLTEVSNGVVDLVPVPGEITNPGTPLNRASMMTLQGFENNSTNISFGDTIVVTSNYSDNTYVATISFSDEITMETNLTDTEGVSVATRITISFENGINVTKEML